MICMEIYLNIDKMVNCVNNKMLEYDWFLSAHIYSFIINIIIIRRNKVAKAVKQCSIQTTQ